MDESPAGRKTVLRREALARRDALDPAVRAAASSAIVERLSDLLAERSAGVVAATVPIRSEADVLPLMSIAAERGIETALPAVLGDELVFRQWHAGDPMTHGAFGVPEPAADAALFVPDFIILPVAAFDRSGHRLGYGKGHFDRTLSGILAAGGRPLLVGAGFAVQEVAAIPTEPHDVALDVIVTEREMVWSGSSD